MEKSRVSVFVKNYGGRYAGPAPFRIPNPALCIGLVDVDGSVHTFAVEVGNIVRLQINFDVIKVILPPITNLMFVSRIVIPFWFIGLIIVVGDKNNVEEPTILAWQFALV